MNRQELLNQLSITLPELVNRQELLNQLSITLPELDAYLSASMYSAYIGQTELPNDVAMDILEHFSKPKSGKKTLKQSTAIQQETSESPTEFKAENPSSSAMSNPFLQALADSAFQRGYTEELYLQQAHYEGVRQARLEADSLRLQTELNRNKKGIEDLANYLNNAIEDTAIIQKATLENMGKEVMNYQQAMASLKPTLSF